MNITEKEVENIIRMDEERLWHLGRIYADELGQSIFYGSANIAGSRMGTIVDQKSRNPIMDPASKIKGSGEQAVIWALKGLMLHLARYKPPM